MIQAAGPSERFIHMYQTTFHENLLSGSIFELRFLHISPCIPVEVNRRFGRKALRVTLVLLNVYVLLNVFLVCSLTLKMEVGSF
jgi:hypothetical protein